MGNEKQFENKVKKFLEENGCWQVKFFANSMTKSGIPDVLVCWHGRFIGLEIKAEHGKPSPLQLYNLNKIEEAGGLGILLYPKDYETFKQLIQTEERKYYRELRKVRTEWKQKLKL